jgi:GMP synthase-like glutamine amidotransferase
MFKTYREFLNEDISIKYKKENKPNPKKRIFSIVPNTSTFPSEKVLKYLDIPFDVNYFEDKDLEKKFNESKDEIGGIIIHGGPLVDMEQLKQIPKSILESKIPTLGICLGLEVLGTFLGAELSKLPKSDETAGEKKSNLIQCKLSDCELFSGIGDLPGTFDIPFNHKYKINSRPKGTRIIASTIDTPVAGFHYPPTNSWCIQFGLGETLIGDKILSNFYYKICLKQNEEGQ